jgi:hypothetical protein
MDVHSFGVVVARTLLPDTESNLLAKLARLETKEEKLEPIKNIEKMKSSAEFLDSMLQMLQAVPFPDQGTAML